MKLGKLTGYSVKLLKGNRMSALLVCLMFTGTELFFRLAEAALYSIILYVSGMEPAGLFTGASPVQQLVVLICTALRYLTTAPLIYACAYWFLQLCSEEKKRKRVSLSKVILNIKIYKRSLAALLFSKAVGFLFIIPSVFFGSFAYSIISAGIENTENFHLLMAVHAFVMMIVSLGLWFWAKLAMLAVPYLMIRFPQRSAFCCIRNSFSFMKGRRATVLKIIVLYVPQMLLIVTIPVVLPKLFSAVSLCISIGLKEDEYLERNKINSGVGQAGYTAKFSAWAKRRLPPSADKAQTAGYGDHS